MEIELFKTKQKNKNEGYSQGGTLGELYNLRYIY